MHFSGSSAGDSDVDLNTQIDQINRANQIFDELHQS
jgi:hypothetical protein